MSHNVETCRHKRLGTTPKDVFEANKTAAAGSKRPKYSDASARDKYCGGVDASSSRNINGRDNGISSSSSRHTNTRRRVVGAAASEDEGYQAEVSIGSARAIQHKYYQIWPPGPAPAGGPMESGKSKRDECSLDSRDKSSVEGTSVSQDRSVKRHCGEIKPLVSPPGEAVGTDSLEGGAYTEVVVKVEPYDGSYVCLICSKSVRGCEFLYCSQCSCNPFHRTCVEETQYKEICPQCSRKSLLTSAPRHDQQ